MALIPTIISPGVEMIEIDNSLRAAIPTGTTLYIPGFASQGPTSEVTYLSDIENFIEIFGYPTNAAERYFYSTVEQAFQSTAQIAVTRLPYGSGNGDTTSPQYTMLAYPATGFALSDNGDYSFEKLDNYSSGSTVSGYEDSATFIIGEPVQFNISLEQYYKFINNESLTGSGEFIWEDIIPEEVSTELGDLGKFAFLTLNVGKTVTNDLYEGYYLGLSDNAFSDPNARYSAITKLKTVSLVPSSLSQGITGLDYTTVPEQRLDFTLDSDLKGCVSQIMEESITTFDISGSQWNDTLNFGIFKIREATNSGDALKLSALIYEGYNASLFYGRKTTSNTTTRAVDFFIENTISNSTLLNVFVNPNLSGALNARGLNTDGTPKVKVRVLAQQLFDISISDAEMALLNSITDPTAKQMKLAEIMSLPAGITHTVLANMDVYSKMKLADSLYPIGLYTQSNNSTKVIGNVPAKVSSALNLIENEELYNIDILLEGGLGSIYVGAQDAATNAYKEVLENAIEIDTARGDGMTTEEDNVKALYPYGYIPDSGIYDDTKSIEGVNNMRTGKSVLDETASTVITNHRAVSNEFLKVANSQQNGGRGDVFFIGDTIRQIAIEGKSNKIEQRYGTPLINSEYGSIDDVSHSYSLSIYWPQRHLYNSVVSSYMAVYPYYIKLQDVQNGTQFWAPCSGSIAAKMCSADSNFGPWQAGAGLNNGIISNALDISFNTNQKQRDDLYNISLNPIYNSPNNGLSIWGIRTMIKKPSVFDQITCRRTFLYIHKILRDSAKYFLFEGNTDFTRLQINNTMTPILDRIVNANGIYGYVFICDTRNNTQTVIDNGDLMINVYLQPVRTAERILIALHASTSGTIITEFDS